LVNFVDEDTTKPKFTIETDNNKKTLTYTITSDYALNDNDFIVSDVKDIINPTQAKDYTTD
jgi:hypothetical protein